MVLSIGFYNAHAEEKCGLGVLCIPYSKIDLHSTGCFDKSGNFVQPRLDSLLSVYRLYDTINGKPIQQSLCLDDRHWIYSDKKKNIYWAYKYFYRSKDWLCIEVTRWDQSGHVFIRKAWVRNVSGLVFLSWEKFLTGSSIDGAIFPSSNPLRSAPGKKYPLDPDQPLPGQCAGESVLVKKNWVKVSFACNERFNKKVGWLMWKDENDNLLISIPFEL
jgi:hypothetical protein